MVSAGNDRDAQRLLDPREVAVMLPEQHGQQPIVVELEVRPCLIRRLGAQTAPPSCRPACADAGVPAPLTSPARPFGAARTAATGTILPSRSSPAVTWTDCI